MINRIVSFLPSATELIYEIDAQDLLYGVTHECQYPEDAKKKPKIINSIFDPEKMTSKEIDETTSNLLKDGKDIFVLDEINLKNANPDLIITQTTCEVCAAHNNQVTQATRVLHNKPKIYSMDPHSITDILNGIIDFSRIINKEENGQHLKEKLEEKIRNLKKYNHETKPRILAVEWIEPFFTAGHWVPEMIEIAGGINLISKKGEHSRRLSFDEISKEDPDYIIFMPCGFNTERGLLEYNQSLKEKEEWNKLRAVQEGKVFVVDANAYFSKPSIRTIIGIEILAKIIHPELNISVPNSASSKV